MKWLLSTLRFRAIEIDPRVEREAEEQREIERKERAIKREQVRRDREARELAKAAAEGGVVEEVVPPGTVEPPGTKRKVVHVVPTEEELAPRPRTFEEEQDEIAASGSPVLRQRTRDLTTTTQSWEDVLTSGAHPPPSDPADRPPVQMLRLILTLMLFNSWIPTRSQQWTH